MPAPKVHHLNCTTMCARFGVGDLVCHTLLIETTEGLVLVDGGMGTLGLSQPEVFGKPFLFAARPTYTHDDTALAHVERLGFRAADVRHIVVTHLDLDHAGALPDFPDAHVHVHAAELEAALARATLQEQKRYVPAEWAHDVRWRRLLPDGETWQGFAAARAVPGLGDDVLMVPLVGHTRGHAGIAVRSASGWLLHAGDAYFHRDQMRGRSAPLALRMFQRMVDMDTKARIANQARLVELVAQKHANVRVFSAHDPVEFAAFTAAA